MKRKTFGFAVVAIAAVLVVGFGAAGSARPAPTPSPSPTPVADPAITKLARQQFVAWQAGVVNQSQYAPQLQAKIDPAKITQMSQQLGQLGALIDMVFIGPWSGPDFPAGARGYIYQMRCVSGNIYLWMALDPSGKVATIFFKNRLDVETITPAPSPSSS